MPDDIDASITDWKRRMEDKTAAILLKVDEGSLKAALFCEGEAKKNAMERIYNTPIKLGKNGKQLWRRTGLYKASIGSGMDPNKSHSAIVFATVPYAKWLEYGTSRNPTALMILNDSIFKNKENIKKIIAQHINKETSK